MLKLTHKKYLIKIKNLPIHQSIENKANYYDIAKNHIIKGSGKKENLSLNIDEILYGK